MTTLTVTPAHDGKHKYTAVFTHADGSTKTIHFGAAGMTDYLQSKDKLRRERYLTRHRGREDWNNPETAGALSRHLLWGSSTSLATNLASFRKRFSL